MSKMGSIVGRLWSSFVRNQWRVFFASVPTAAVATCYAIWTLRKKLRTHRSLTQNRDQTTTGVLCNEQKLIDETNEEQPIATKSRTNISLLTSEPDSRPGGVAKPFPSPTDSGYQEPSTPDKTNIEFSVIPVPQPPPSSLSGVCPAIDTTVIRGGRARSTIQLPIDIIGRFIGRQGKNIKSLMAESGAQIHVQQKILSKDATVVPCILQGTQTQISNAIDLICVRHPEVSLPSPSVYIPPLSMCTTVSSPTSCSTSWDYTLKPPHIPSTVFLAIVTYIEKLNRIWLVPYSSTQLLEELHRSMASAYKNETTSDHDIQDVIGKFCAVQVNEVYWLRGKVVGKTKDILYEVQLMDYGSSVIVPVSSLKPLRKEHTQIPIQSLPFLLSNVQPITSDCEDGMLVLQALVEGAVLESHATGAASPDDGTPYLELYTQSQPGNDCQTFINRELVNQGFALWKEVTPDSLTSSSSFSPVIPSNSQLVQNEHPTTVVTTTTPSVAVVGSDQSSGSITLPRSVTLSDLLSSGPFPSEGSSKSLSHLPKHLSPVLSSVDPMKALFGDQLHLLTQVTQPNST